MTPALRSSACPCNTCPMAGDDSPLRLLILGAHPDDAEYHAGGTAAIYRDLGHTVRMISVTNGAAGHHEKAGRELAVIREAEARRSGQTIGADYIVWNEPDGALMPTLDVRLRIIRELRTYQPDIVLTHRPNDYHPDHRAVGQLVQDASYMVTVPAVAPDTPALSRDPVIAYLPDLFTKPTPLEPHVIVDVSDKTDTIVSMLACHASQVFEWLPYNEGRLAQVPADDAGRMVWLRSWYDEKVKPRAARFREAIIAAYGQSRGAAMDYVEVFEVSEYAAPLDAAARKRLFPFAP